MGLSSLFLWPQPQLLEFAHLIRSQLVAFKCQPSPNGVSPPQKTFATCAIFALTLPRGSTSLIAIPGAQLERLNARTPLALAGINAEDVALQFKLINVPDLLAFW